MKAGTRILIAGLAVLAGMVALFAFRPWVLDRLELSLLDARFRLRGTVASADRVVIVAIDEKSIDELGRWPWRRSLMAGLLDRLTQADVAAVGLDIVFSEPEITPETEMLFDLRRSVASRKGGDRGMLELLDHALMNAETDRLLAGAIARSGKTVLGYFFRTERGQDVDETLLQESVARVRKSRVSVARLPPEGTAPILTCSGVEANLAPFQAVGRGLGFFSTLRDRDGVIRRAPLVALCGGELHVSLSLALLEAVEGQRAMVLGNREGIREIRLGDTVFPTDEGGRVLVNFRGPPGTFKHYSASDVLAGRLPREALEGKIALIGATEIGIGDIQTTPFGVSFPGVEVHATVLDNLLSGTVLRRHDGLVFIELAAVLLLGLLVTLAGSRLRSAADVAAVAALLFVLALGTSAYAFVANGIWVNLTYPALTVIAVYMAVAVTHSITIEARARLIRQQFATYVPPGVVNEMVEHPESFRLGGERRDLSILFSDVRNFTTLAEEIAPEDVARLLNEYLTPMTEIVFETRGTLDKYIGDAIVAFWGAPLPVEDHPQRACEAAIAMQEGLDYLRSNRPDLPGVERLRIGIGLHSGPAVVGNMGSELRFDYSVTGDGVNLCSRLEGLTKFYGVGILASAELVSRTSGISVRELDQVRVKGKRESVRILEVLSREGSGTLGPGAIEAYAKGLKAYREARWDDAEKALQEVLALRGGRDTASLLLLQRIRLLKQETPEGWDGTWVFEEK